VGMSLASELGCTALGLFIIVFFRFVKMPLLEVHHLKMLDLGFEHVAIKVY
jgi:hypothetical protein